MPPSPPAPTNSLTIRGSVHDGAARVQLHGPLSLRTTQQLDGFLVHLLHGGINEVELGLQNLTRLDSAGVAMLLRIQHNARRDGWRVSMVAPPAHLRHQLERMGVAEKLPFA